MDLAEFASFDLANLGSSFGLDRKKNSEITSDDLCYGSTI
jgi:hypothetical protein